MFSAPITRLRTFAARGITATTGNDCPGADRKSFCLLLGKKFCGMYISPLDWRRRLWLSVPPATGTHTGVWHRTQQRAGTRRNDEERVRETALPLTSRRPFAGMPGAQVTARQRRRDRNGRCKPGGSRQGWKPARAETAPLAPFTTARPARGTPGKGISRRTTKQTIIRAAVIRGKRLARTVLIFTERSDQLSRATDRVPGLPANPGYAQ